MTVYLASDLSAQTSVSGTLSVARGLECSMAARSRMTAKLSGGTSAGSVITYGFYLNDGLEPGIAITGGTDVVGGPV